MSAAPFSYPRRPFGRAPSPPTWACYEQIPYSDGGDSDTGSDRDSCSEDEEDYGSPERGEPEPEADSSEAEAAPTAAEPERRDSDVAPADDMDVEGDAAAPAAPSSPEEPKKDVKGKQRAVDAEKNETPRRREGRRKHRDPVQTLRPILTIQKSQGFVWNQDLFVPPYIRDRYVVSTSPPKASGAVATSAVSYNPMEYDVEVVEIHIEEDEFKHIIP